MRVLYDHPFYTFSLEEDDSLIVFKWKATTETLTEDDFKEALHNFSGFASEYRSPYLLVDVLDFKFQMTQELGIWREHDISPRYKKAGTKKFGYVMPAEVVSQMKVGQGGTERGFEESYFESKESAINWFHAR